MKPKIKASSGKQLSPPDSAVARGKAAAKAMSKELTAEHKRWNMPLLSWKDGKVVETKP